MKTKFISGLVGFMMAGAAFGQVPLFKNFQSLNNPPPIDATSVQNFNRITTVGTLPFDTQNTLYFLNENGAVMDLTPGGRFDYLPYNGATGNYGVRTSSFGFTNRGQIFSTVNLLVDSTNIVSSGFGASTLLSVTENGKIVLKGQNVNLSRSGVRAGLNSAVGYPNEGFNSDPYFFNPANVEDVYWGGGVGPNVSLATVASGGLTPSHRVTYRSLGTTTTSLNINPAAPAVPGYSTFCYTNYSRINATTIHATLGIVFIQTNFPNATGVRVFFINQTNSNNFRPQEVIVEYSSTDFDPITQQSVTNYTYVTDRTATFARPNVNTLTGTGFLENYYFIGQFRPETIEVERSGFAFLPPLFAATETVFDPLTVFTTSANGVNGRYEAGNVAQVYAALGITAASRDLNGNGTVGGSPTEVTDLTNSPGRIHITADTLNLNQTIIRADSLLTIQANRITNMVGFRSDAQNMDLQLLAPSGNVTFSNAFTSTVRRMNGQISLWSGVWQVAQFVTNGHPAFTNVVTDSIFNNSSNQVEWLYHMMVVDHTMSTNVQVAAENFVVKTTNHIDLKDPLTVNRKFEMDATSLLIDTTGSLTMSGTNLDITANNFPNLYNFTNWGAVIVPSVLNLGYDRPDPYSNVINGGSIFAGTVFFRSHYYENTNTVFASSGPMFVSALTNRLGGSFNFSFGVMQFEADDLVITNSLLITSNALVLTVTNRLDDLDVTNEWSVANGFLVSLKPAKGDLLSTRITTIAKQPNTIHYWPGEDRGTNAAGYANNLAVGTLAFDAQPGQVLQFYGAGTSNGLYVSHLEFLNYTTNYAASIFVDPSLTIYFATTSTNVAPDKLTNAFGGRFVWVDPGVFPGPSMTLQSSISSKTTVSTREYNRLITSSPDVDGDGIPNAQDITPLSGFTLNSVTIASVKLPPTMTPQLVAFITWQGIAGTTYIVESKSGISGTWTQIGSVTPGTTGDVTFSDPLGSKSDSLYRVRYQRLN